MMLSLLSGALPEVTQDTMKTKIHPAPVLAGNYDLRPLDEAQVQGASTAQVGLVRIGAGTRSPAQGLRVSARHEIAYIVAGKVRVDTEQGTALAGAGDVIVSSPTEPHATTAVEDATLFYVLVD